MEGRTVGHVGLPSLRESIDPCTLGMPIAVEAYDTTSTESEIKSRWQPQFPSIIEHTHLVARPDPSGKRVARRHDQLRLGRFGANHLKIPELRVNSVLGIGRHHLQRKPATGTEHRLLGRPEVRYRRHAPPPDGLLGLQFNFS